MDMESVWRRKERELYESITSCIKTYNTEEMYSIVFTLLLSLLNRKR